MHEPTPLTSYSFELIGVETDMRVALCWENRTRAISPSPSGALRFSRNPVSTNQLVKVRIPSSHAMAQQPAYIYVGRVIINLQLFQHGHTRAGASETVVLRSPGGSKDATSDGGTLEPTLKQSPRLRSADCGRSRPAKLDMICEIPLSP